MLRDWQRSGLTLAGFARERELSYWTLWDWKRRLGIERRKVPVHVQPARHPRKNERSGPEFVPVRLVEPGIACAPNTEVVPSARLEVLLRCGRGIRFDESCSLPFLASVVAILEGC